MLEEMIDKDNYHIIHIDNIYNIFNNYILYYIYIYYSSLYTPPCISSRYG